MRARADDQAGGGGLADQCHVRGPSVSAEGIHTPHVRRLPRLPCYQGGTRAYQMRDRREVIGRGGYSLWQMQGF